MVAKVVHNAAPAPSAAHQASCKSIRQLRLLVVALLEAESMDPPTRCWLNVRAGVERVQRLRGQGDIPLPGLRAARLEAGLTQDDLARVSGVWGAGYFDRGDAWASLETAQRLASALGCAVDDLMRFQIAQRCEAFPHASPEPPIISATRNDASRRLVTA